MKTKLLLFDFDGTLFNTAPGIHKAVNMVAKERGLEDFSFELVTQLIGYGAESLIHHLDDYSKHRLGEITQMTQRFRQVYDEIALDNSEIFPGAIDFLKSWDGELGIVSNKGEGALKMLVENSELSTFNWKCVFGGDTFEQKKPHPLPLLKAMEVAGFSTLDTILVGDGVPDAKSSQAANLPFIGVRFGYAPESLLIQNGCYFFIDSYSELSQQIQLVDAAR